MITWLILLLAVPVGFLVSWLSRDELIQGRKYFRILVITSILAFLGFWLYGRPIEAWSSGFIGIVSLVSLITSGDKRFAIKRKI
jgi:amino acid permease